jgi:hypothetical protein
VAVEWRDVSAATGTPSRAAQPVSAALSTQPHTSASGGFRLLFFIPGSARNMCLSGTVFNAVP